jgi:hypothetical protein
VAIERQVRDQLRQLRILMPHRPQLAHLGEAEPGELFLPAIERLLADAEPATDPGDLLAAFDLVERVDDFFVAAAFAWRRVPPLAGPR